MPPAHQVDLADADATRALVDQVRPDLVLHTAYATADGQRAIVEASTNVARSCAATGSALVHLSSDVVYDGEHGPYDESSPPMPISVYGRHKAEAEAVVADTCPDSAIVRTSLITWADPLDPRSAWVADALRAHEPITLFTDEIRHAVRLDDLSAQLWEVAALDRPERAGVWHLVGSEPLSRYDLGVLIAHHCGLDPAGITARSSRGLVPPRPREVHLTARRSDEALATPARSARTLFVAT
jgi:dTDP-4-dehydrorhamnose reductase